MFFKTRMQFEHFVAVLAGNSGLGEVEDPDVLADARLGLALSRAKQAHVREVRVVVGLTLADLSVGTHQRFLVDFGN
jgi:hypothetical protein